MERFSLSSFTLTAFASLTLLAGTAFAKPIPDNLGNGLDKLVASKLALNEAKASGASLNHVRGSDGKKYVNVQTAMFGANSITDDQDRVLVRVTLNGAASFKDTKKGMKAAIGSLTITAIDKAYRGVGVMNAFVDLADVPALAQLPGVSAVILEQKPIVRKANLDKALSAEGPRVTAGQTLTKLGTAFDQGVTQHRVDTINQYYNPSAPVDFEGQGMQVACISNSFAAHTARPASTDVTNFDLPGASNNPVNTTPVFIPTVNGVYQDDIASSASDDEGRAMCQIVYKMAPRAAVGFATADFGEVGFANNIRTLAGIPANLGTNQTFAADTICDDVGYGDEPFFQDGIIGNGVDDASAFGVAYFSSAANDIGTNGYDSDLRFVANGTGLTFAAGNTALANTNINLANVPPALYAGGFHNFNPNGMDVAQTVNDPVSSTTPTELQWNEAYDQTAQPNNLVNIYSTSGTYTNAAAGTAGDLTFTITATLTAGVTYQLNETAAAGSAFDGIITVLDPSGAVIVNKQDTGGDETVRFIAPVSGGNYMVRVGHYATTTGAFNLNLFSTTGFTVYNVKTQIYLLVFDTAGNFIADSSAFQNPLATNEPIQTALTIPTTGSQVQFVIARGNIPAPGPGVATHVRYLLAGNGAPGLGPDEYFKYTTVTTAGHAAAATCNGCAAVSVFRPSLPETFSSPGPFTVYFDKLNNPLGTPDVRLQPHIAAADAGNVSSNMNGFFASDSASDPDTNGNFSGTSAAGPHAAAIAALVLQAHGGRHSMNPAQMTSVLERSTFAHDLDPNFVSGSAKVSTGGKVTVTINSDGSSNTSTGLNDNNAFTINYIGGSSVNSFVFNPGGTSATAGNVSGGDNGLTYTPTGSTTVGGTTTYFENSLPGAIFRGSAKGFTLGNTTVTGATAAFSNPSNAAATENYTMTITIPSGQLSGGNILRFGVGRGVARTSGTGNTGVVVQSVVGAAYNAADIFGGGVILPSGTVVSNGMTFNGTTADGGSFNGVIKNNVGAGYSPLDGFGFVNAQAAVAATVQ